MHSGMPFSGPLVCAAPVGLVRLPEDLAGLEVQVGVEAAVEAVDALERRLGELDGGELAGVERPPRRGDGEEVEAGHRGSRGGPAIGSTSSSSRTSRLVASAPTSASAAASRSGGGRCPESAVRASVCSGVGSSKRPDATGLAPPGAGRGESPRARPRRPRGRRRPGRPDDGGRAAPPRRRLPRRRPPRRADRVGQGGRRPAAHARDVGRLGHRSRGDRRRPVDAGADRLRRRRGGPARRPRGARRHVWLPRPSAGPGRAPAPPPARAARRPRRAPARAAVLRAGRRRRDRRARRRAGCGRATWSAATGPTARCAAGSA